MDLEVIFKQNMGTLTESNRLWKEYSAVKCRADALQTSAAVLLKEVHQSFYDVIQKKYNVQPKVDLVLDKSVITGMTINWDDNMGNAGAREYRMKDYEEESKKATKKSSTDNTAKGPTKKD